MYKMPKQMPKEWYDENERLNEGHTLVLGERVCDTQGREGNVTSIYPNSPEEWVAHGELTISEHGMVTVLLDCHYDGSPLDGKEPCDEEHWVLINWHRHLRRIDQL